MLAPSLDSPLTRSFSSPARGLERDGISSPVAVEEDFDGLSKGALYKRKDFLDVEEDAKLHPERTYYYRKVVDLDKAIEQCNRKLAESPRNLKALTTRAGCFMKKKLFAKAADDFSAVLAVTPEDVSVLYSRGAAYDKLGQTTDAIVSVQLRSWSRGNRVCGRSAARLVLQLESSDRSRLRHQLTEVWSWTEVVDRRGAGSRRVQAVGRQLGHLAIRAG
jgi:hypothetical protein